MTPIHSTEENTEPVTDETHVGDYSGDELQDDAPEVDAAPVEKPAKEKIDWGQKLKDNYLLVLGALGVLIVAGLFLWLRSATAAVVENTEPIAAASTNIDASIPAPVTDQVAPPSPSETLERQRQNKLTGTPQEEKPSADQLAGKMLMDTVGMGAQKRAAAQEKARRQAIATARASNVDTIETTIQDPNTGAYRAATVTVPRSRTRAASSSADSYGGGGRSRGVRPSGGSASYGRTAAAPRAAKLPTHDVDGTPFETDPDVLQMLSASPQATRDSYEKMTGRRYRDPKAGLASVAGVGNSRGGVLIPDGFNTIKLRAATDKGQGSNNGGEEEALVPDTFFKCVINGEQNVRTGSVVMLRLLEDAVVSGATFPKNMVFAGIASVQTNRVTLQVVRLGATRVKADIYDFNYMPGIMIDPGKRAPVDPNMSMMGSMQTTGFTEMSSAIDRSASAANSPVGVAGRMGAAMLQRMPRKGQKLREVLLPDGYPILITTDAGAGQ